MLARCWSWEVFNKCNYHAYYSCVHCQSLTFSEMPGGSICDRQWGLFLLFTLSQGSWVTPPGWMVSPDPVGKSWHSKSPSPPGGHDPAGKGDGAEMQPSAGGRHWGRGWQETSLLQQLTWNSSDHLNWGPAKGGSSSFPPECLSFSFFSGKMDVRVGLWRKLSTDKLMLLKCGVGEDSWESLGLQGDPTSPS